MRTAPFTIRLILPLITLLSVCTSGCNSLPGIGGPGRGRHRITITELALSESDFTNSALGSPKPLLLRAYKDGAAVEIGRVDGFRGPRQVGLSFELDYDPNSR